MHLLASCTAIFLLALCILYVCYLLIHFATR